MSGAPPFRTCAYYYRGACIPSPPNLAFPFLTTPVAKLNLDISRRKTTLSNIQERVNELVAAKASISQSIADLHTMSKHSQPSVINFDGLHDIPAMEQRLNRIEALVRPLVQQAEQQSCQIDTFLDGYEQLMRMLDGVKVPP